ncbi:CUE domain-containing protein 1-like [Dendronephthya gigantea]|uniref:CUE domain-containing protein 1-like n=1 Tax=Dendronephthya gigantea TaxID=151771 RepID=UPI00106D3D28|nr:CUE domain-containing protein 1-like [Dendronephthya gigantea]
MSSRTAELAASVPRSRQLDFNKAMSDFKVMFPTFDYEVIEMVLRANNGLVDATVDQLLEMQDENDETKENGLLDPELNVRLPCYDDAGSTTFEPPPAYTPRVEEDPNFRYDSSFLEPHLSSFNAYPSSQNTPPSSRASSQFQPPLVGTLPNDFLRLNLDDNGANFNRPSGHSPQLRQDEGIYAENPLYEVSSVGRKQCMGSFGTPRYNQDPGPSSRAVSGPTAVNGYDHGFDSIPSDQSQAKSCGKKGKSKKFGQMSRKFKRKKTKTSKGPTYQQMSGTNLIDDDSGDDRDVPR